jgi:hypothetical protein
MCEVTNIYIYIYLGLCSSVSFVNVLMQLYVLLTHTLKNKYMFPSCLHDQGRHFCTGLGLCRRGHGEAGAGGEDWPVPKNYMNANFAIP